MRKIILAIGIYASCVVLSAQDLSHKNLSNFPHYLYFRGEYNNANHVSYESWVSSQVQTEGAIKKYITEELNVKPSEDTVCAWLNRYAEEDPSRLNLIHWNGEARQLFGVEGPLNGADLYFPGHWVYKPGSLLTQDCDADTTQIHVSSVVPFSATAHDGKGDYILLVKLDENGNRLWDQAEIAQVQGVDRGNNRLTIERGLAYSKQSFKADSTYIAPVVGMSLNFRIMFFYNLSSHCPRDSNGKTAADCLVDELGGYLAPGGKLENLDGIAFDVNYFQRGHKSDWDVNNDGIGDGGWIDNKNSWLEGDYNFLKNLRSRLGDVAIITADAHHAGNQQAVNVLNGLESEGLVQHNDAWRGISRTINTHLYWQSHTVDIQPYSYITSKRKNDSDAAARERMDRFIAGYASSLGASITGPPKDWSAFPYWMQEPGTLGKPIGSLIRYAKLSPKDSIVLNSSDIISNISSDNCDITELNGEIIVASKTGYGADEEMTLSMTDIQFPAGDVTIFVEAQAIDPLEGMTHADKVPRVFELSITGLPNYGEGNFMNQYYTYLYGFMGTSKPEDISFYYRRPGVGAGDQNISMSIQGRGQFKIKSIRIYNEADIIIRSFERAIVIVNPALDQRTVDLSLAFPGQSEQVIDVPAVDACFFNEDSANLEPIYRNVALNKPVNFSSFVSNHDNLVDGTINHLSLWDARGYPQSAIIDLEAVYDIDRFEIYPYMDRAYQYTIDVKPDEVSYFETVVDRTGNTTGGKVIVDSVSTKARFIRITVTGASDYSGSQVGLTEFMAFGSQTIITKVTGVSVNPTTLSLTPSETAQLSAILIPADATDTTVTWSSDNPTVANVNNEGLVKAYSGGTARVTATTNDGSYTSTCNVTVSTIDTAVNVGSNDLPSINIFPNPTSGNIHIWIDEEDGSTNANIIDLSGRVFISGVLYRGENTIDLSSLNQGIYILQLKKGKTIIDKIKIVKI